MSDSGQTVVLGGGIIGAMCAWFLSKSGHSVTIVDEGRFGAGCSHGNCGYVSPSHVLPLTAPGALARSLKMMFRRDSPFTIKPRFSPSLWKWLWNFARRCNEHDMLTAAQARYGLLSSSMELYLDLIESENIDCEWEKRGLLFVFLSEQEFEEFEHAEKLVHDQFGLRAKPYDGQTLTDLEPALKSGLGGGWHYEDDCHLRPDKMMSGLRRLLESRGVSIIENLKVNGIRREGGKAVAMDSAGESIAGNTFVVATGALTPFLNSALGCKIPIQPGKGYSITMPRPERCPSIPMLLEHHRVGITPMQSAYRIGSTMEFAGYDKTLNRKRLDLLRRSAEVYLHEPYCEPVEEEWFGWRPMTWDGKPFIDRSPIMNNVWVAAGHNMLGLSMAPATGKLVAELVGGEAPHIDPKPFSLGRL
jgi:D-amino-acid dehydrogenase